jgi:hypothetical protein
VELVKLSMADEQVLTVLLTGRSEAGFGELVGRMVKSKGLEFDMVVLKPLVGTNNERFKSTMEFKQTFLTSLVNTYNNANIFTIYEDRKNHVTDFRKWIEDFNSSAGYSGGRPPFEGTVVPVKEIASTLDPLIEATTIQAIVNAHNQAVLDGKSGDSFKPLYIKKFPIGFGHSRKKERFKLSIELEPDPSAPIGDTSAAPLLAATTNFKDNRNQYNVHQHPHHGGQQSNHRQWRKGAPRDRGGRSRGRGHGRGGGVFKSYKDLDATHKGVRTPAAESNMYNAY